MKRTVRECPNCNAVVSLSNFDRHVASVSCAHGGKGKTKKEKHPWGVWAVGPNLFQLPCGYQGTKVACRGKLNCDAAIEKNGGNLKIYNEKIAIGLLDVHNKGEELSADHKDKISKALKVSLKDNPASAVTRAKLSKARSQFLLKNPDRQLNSLLASNRNRMTYPERVADGWFKANEVQAEYNKRVGRYYPDFLVGLVVVEIDGPRWHSSVEQVARDSRRDGDLAAMGYQVHRICATSRIEDALMGMKVKGLFG